MDVPAKGNSGGGRSRRQPRPGAVAFSACARAVGRPLHRDQSALLSAFRPARHRADAAARTRPGPRTGRSRRAGLWRAVAAPCRRRARHADPAAARLLAGETRPGAGARADLCRARPRRGARRPCGCRGPRFRRARRCRPRHRRQPEQSGRPGRRRAQTCLRSPKRCAAEAGCSSSTRPSWMSARARKSLCGDVGQGGIVVLRSFGKFFGLAGVRLGFAIASEA